MDGIAREVRALLSAALDDPASTWTLGSFGAFAEFRRGNDEAAWRLGAGQMGDGQMGEGRVGYITRRGAIALDPVPGLVPVAYETPLDGGWSHAIAFCLPENSCGLSRRAVVTEIGPDTGAIRSEDRAAILFDLGLGLPQADACLRTSDPTTLARLRTACGASPFDPGAPLFDPGRQVSTRLATPMADHVFVARIGRIEIRPDGTAPTPGPQAYLSAQVLRTGRTHAATAPIPSGLVPCAHLHPAHPCRDEGYRPIAFRHKRHAAFQTLYARWGDPDHIVLKARIMAGESTLDGPSDRHARAVAKVASRQMESLRRADAAR